jgi:hypothetical protein
MTTIERIADQGWRPNLFIAGFSKCGSTELCDYLSQHPDIFVPTWKKEPTTFYDLPKFPAYQSGDPTGNTKTYSIISLNDYYEMFSKEKKYRYRTDGSVSYAFDPKFAHILKSFSENAKVILVIRNQKRRLASMYFYSLAIHNENDFTRWLHDYFVPYIGTYLYYDKIAAYYHQFGDNNHLRIIETDNLSSDDVHKQLFEYLEVKPIKISIKHKNTTLLGPEDSKGYRQLILILTKIRLQTLRVGEQIGLKKQAGRATMVMSDLAHQLFKKRQNKKNNNNYSEIIKLIPNTISSILEEDYRKSLDFAIQKRILIRPAY